MSDEQGSRQKGTATSKPIHVRHSGNAGMKWVAGAAAAAVLLGGGYYAWKNYHPTQTASNASQVTDDPATYAGPVADEPTGARATADNSATADSSAATVAPTDNPAAQTHVRPKKIVTASAVPEETIGVSKVAASENQSEELVVPGARRPVWRYTPSAERLSEYYPAYALDRGREGEASLHCTIGKRGALDCERVSEYPANAGFGRAALQVARSFRHADQRADGSSAIGTPINLHVMFRMADGERRT